MRPSLSNDTAWTTEAAACCRVGWAGMWLGNGRNRTWILVRVAVAGVKSCASQRPSATHDIGNKTSQGRLSSSMCSDDNWSHRTPQDYRRHGLLHVPGCGRYGVSRGQPHFRSLRCRATRAVSLAETASIDSFYRLHEKVMTPHRSGRYDATHPSKGCWCKAVTRLSLRDSQRMGRSRHTTVP
jgi:hypothetical protein